jgi:hypothetical protein
METDKKIVEQRLLARIRLLQSQVKNIALGIDRDFSIEEMLQVQGALESFIDRISTTYFE